MGVGVGVGESILAGAIEPTLCPLRFYCPAVDSALDSLPRVCPAGAFCNQTGLAAATLCPVGYAFIPSWRMRVYLLAVIY